MKIPKYVKSFVKDIKDDCTSVYIEYDHGDSWIVSIVSNGVTKKSYDITEHCIRAFDIE